MNNLKLIREIYGATQEQIAMLLGVNRVTVTKWENGDTRISPANQEKLSLYYGIGPEYFYDKEIDSTIVEMLVASAKRSRTVSEQTQGIRIKERDFNKFFSTQTFSEALQRYTYSMKALLALAETADLETLKTAELVNRKMGERLKSIIELKESEKKANEPSLQELWDMLDSMITTNGSK